MSLKNMSNQHYEFSLNNTTQYNHLNLSPLIKKTQSDLIDFPKLNEIIKIKNIITDDQIDNKNK